MKVKTEKQLVDKIKGKIAEKHKNMKQMSYFTNYTYNQIFRFFNEGKLKILFSVLEALNLEIEIKEKQ
jgi:hypothetical protein